MTNFKNSYGSLVKYHGSANSKVARGVEVSSLSNDGVSVVVLGGALTRNVNSTEWYMSKVAPVLQSDFKDVALYCGYYQFNDVDPMLVKAHAFRTAGFCFPLPKQQEEQLQCLLENEPEIGYVQDLYDLIIEPCFHDTQESTIRNLRRIVFYTDCHGSVTLWHMVDKAKAALKAKGWSDEAIAKTLKNIVAVQHEPTSPLSNVLHTSYSFVSASDETMNFYDKRSLEFKGKRDMPPTYMGADYSNLLVVGHLKNNNLSEHGFYDVFGPEDNPDVSEYGRLLYRAQRNVLKNVVNAAERRTSIPSWGQAVSPNIDLKSIMHSKGKYNGR